MTAKLVAKERWLLLALLRIAFAGAAHAQSAYSVEIDLEEQTAYLLRGRQIVLPARFRLAAQVT